MGFESKLYNCIQQKYIWEFYILYYSAVGLYFIELPK